MNAYDAGVWRELRVLRTVFRDRSIVRIGLGLARSIMFCDCDSKGGGRIGLVLFWGWSV